MLRVVAHEVDRARLTALREQRPSPLLCPGPQALDRPRRERLGDEPAKPGVERRLEVEHLPALERLEVLPPWIAPYRHVRGETELVRRVAVEECGPEPPVAKAGVDVGEAGEVPEVIAVRVPHRGRLADPCICGVWIGHERRVRRIEDGAGRQ